MKPPKVIHPPKVIISYLVLVHNEENAFELLRIILDNKWPDDKVIVLEDSCTPDYLSRLSALPVKVIHHKLNHDFSKHRNYALSFCKGDYIFALDGDELVPGPMIKNIRSVLFFYRWPGAAWIPRQNIFTGIKPIHAIMFNWSLHNGLVNWPDTQLRLFKRRQGLKWVGVLHEQIKFDPKIHKVVTLPIDPQYAIIHKKTIEEQLNNNEKYNREYSFEDNAGLATQKLIAL
jgi:glycosyltransferase involved in cell wall biosynthesis